MRREALVGALLVVTAAHVAAAQSASPRAFAHHETIWMAFDSTSGYSTVELRPMRIADSLTLAVVAVSPGTRFVTPPYLSVAFTAVGAVSRRTGAREMDVVIDGRTAWHAARDDVLRTVDSAAGGASETVALRMPTRVFFQLARAPAPILRVGGRPLALGAEQLEALRDVASRLSPEGYARARAASPVIAPTRHMRVRKDFYEPTEVDQRAVPSAFHGSPRFPDLPEAQRLPRQVLVEFVVDTTGRVDLATLRGRSPAEDALFVEVLRLAMVKWEYTAATKDGRKVRQIVRQAIQFDPRPTVP